MMRRLFWDVIYQLIIIINLSLMFLFRHLLHSYLYISLKINKNFECPLKTAITVIDIDIDIQNKVNSIRNFYLFIDPLLGKEAQSDGLVRSAVVRSKRAITNEKSTYYEIFSFLHLNFSPTLLLP